ncbi:MAG: hypothetical protein KAI98_05690 [Gemmatimonadetes bacterium]|nr:hypothetical protein [Gemmatimonadota bacterium]MCK5483076.1 hypothetical protein [Gemmatimonadota bacterium]MCK5489456.1 hypothetical protein [Gemmatimonadota bacterium]
MTAIKADNDTWTAELGGLAREGFRTVVFFCSSNGQRPYRVAEVPAERFASQDDLERLPENELRELFGETTSMGVRRSYD